MAAAKKTMVTRSEERCGPVDDPAQNVAAHLVGSHPVGLAGGAQAAIRRNLDGVIGSQKRSQDAGDNEDDDKQYPEK
jgi:hypothetical protein